MPDTPAPAPDPVLARRAQIARLVQAGSRLGYTLFAVSLILFFVGLATTYTPRITGIIVACLIVGSFVLAPAIVFGYAVKAAERDDREHGRL